MTGTIKQRLTQIALEEPFPSPDEIERLVDQVAPAMAKENVKLRVALERAYELVKDMARKGERPNEVKYVKRHIEKVLFFPGDDE